MQAGDEGAVSPASYALGRPYEVRRDHRHGAGAGREHRWTQQRTGGTGHHGNRSECAVHERSHLDKEQTDGEPTDPGPVPAARITSARPATDTPPTRTRVRVSPRPERVAPPRGTLDVARIARQLRDRTIN
ncbi:hypothetical protein [Streptomyces sp. NPDC056192]|uniref:hypothetical protein n=1 Tax=Streptomyces sp. NPDC056192 TaxID=3345743 RepID=UPI0035DE8373